MSEDSIVFQWPNKLQVLQNLLQEIHKHVTMFFAEQHFSVHVTSFCDSVTKLGYTVMQVFLV